MEKIIKVQLMDGYDPAEDNNGQYMTFNVIGEHWNSIEEPPKNEGEYLLAIWDGYDMVYDVCCYEKGKWEVTNDWYEGTPIAYVAWMDLNGIVPCIP